MEKGSVVVTATRTRMEDQRQRQRSSARKRSVCRGNKRWVRGDLSVIFEKGRSGRVRGLHVAAMMPLIFFSRVESMHGCVPDFSNEKSFSV